jgi:hypothetical protein
MTLRPIHTSAAICALAALLCGGTATGAVFTQADFTVTTTYLATYHITAQGANVVVDAYDVSAACSDQNVSAYLFDIGSGNLNGTPSVNSPFQVWALGGSRGTVQKTVDENTAGIFLSTTDGTYGADTHIVTDLDSAASDTETNNACYADGTAVGTYQIGVGSLDYWGSDYAADANSPHIDLANVGIVRGTTVSAYVQLGGIGGSIVPFPAITFPGSPLAGDANGDGKVDINDLTIVLSNYGQTGSAWSQGDLNGDGKVDINDLTVVLSNYGQTLHAAGAGVAAVPEPGVLALLGAGLAGLLVCARRKHRKLELRS